MARACFQSGACFIRDSNPRSLFLVQAVGQQEVLVLLGQGLGVEVAELAEAVQLVLDLALEGDALGARVDGRTIRRPVARTLPLDGVLKADHTFSMVEGARFGDFLIWRLD